MSLCLLGGCSTIQSVLSHLLHHFRLVDGDGDDDFVTVSVQVPAWSKTQQARLKLMQICLPLPPEENAGIKDLWPPYLASFCISYELILEEWAKCEHGERQHYSVFIIYHSTISSTKIVYA